MCDVRSQVINLAKGKRQFVYFKSHHFKENKEINHKDDKEKQLHYSMKK